MTELILANRNTKRSNRLYTMLRWSNNNWFTDVNGRAYCLPYFGTTLEGCMTLINGQVSGKTAATKIFYTDTSGYAGVVSHVDNPFKPSNYVAAYHDGTNARLEKCVDTVFTSLIMIPVAFVPDAKIEIVRISSNRFQLFYNGVQVGANQTINEASIINNTLYGLCATTKVARFSEFTCDGVINRFNFPGMNYYIRDEFTEAVAAGALNGTLAEVGIRNVTDAGNFLSIAGGKLVRGGGSISSPVLRYAAVVQRIPGVILTWEVPVTSVSVVGYSNVISTGAAEFYYTTATSAYANIGAGIAISADVTYPAKMTMITRQNGSFFFLNNRLIAISDVSNVALNIHIYSSIQVGDLLSYIRQPKTLWIPTPIISDGFSILALSDGLGHAEGVAGTLGKGGGGVEWKTSNNTWSISGGKGLNTPTTPGSEILTDGLFEIWTNANTLTNWATNSAGTSTLNREAVDVYSGTYAARLDIDASNSVVQISQSRATTIGKWYTLSVYAKASLPSMAFGINSGGADKIRTITDSYTLVATTFRASAVSQSIVFKRSSINNSQTIKLDNATLKEIVTETLFRQVIASTPDVLASVSMNVLSGTQAGLALNLDSITNPSNFIIVYHDGVSVVVDKCLAGAYTQLATSTTAYVSGANLVVRKMGNKYRIYYNNVLIGSEITVPDVEITRNINHGLFSTNAGNTFDNLTIYAVGTNQEYENLAEFTS